MQRDEFLMPTMKILPHFCNKMRRASLLLTFLVLSFLLVFSFGCAPSSSPTDGAQSSSAPNDLPELTDEIIRERINYTRVRQIPVENGNGEAISWTFVGNEPKEIIVIDKRIDGSRATVVLDIKTGSGPNARTPRVLAGQIRTEWELKTGWALRTWEIIAVENISMKVSNLPKPPENNSNR